MVAPPPVLFGAALLLACALHWLDPFIIAPRIYLVFPAIVLIAAGLSLSAAILRAFRIAGTPVAPRHGSTRLVLTGLYRYSRNPDYIGQALAYIGIALAMNSWWPLILLPAILPTIHYGVVQREERYLEAKFGDDYRRYKARVPRWL